MILKEIFILGNVSINYCKLIDWLFSYVESIESNFKLIYIISNKNISVKIHIKKFVSFANIWKYFETIKKFVKIN